MSSSPLIELVKALAWPVAVLLVTFALFEPISQFIGALGGRVTRLSVFKVEFELIPATPVARMPLLDDIRAITTAAEISDSSRLMLEQVQVGAPADFAEIAIGCGEEWLTSRLYIAAVMMERMRNVKVFVFVERSSATERRFVAVASVRQLRWALARRYPWLEAACGLALQSVFQSTPVLMQLPQPIFESDTGAFAPSYPGPIVRSFLTSLQRQPVGQPVQPAQPLPGANEWVTLSPMAEERAVWVTRELLTSLLPKEALSAWADILLDAPHAQRTRTVLRRSGPFVALLDADRQFIRLVSREALLEKVAVSVSEEPEGAPPR